MPTIETTLMQRGNRYGDFKSGAKLAQELHETMAYHDGWTNLTKDKRFALYMIGAKISRIINGNAEYKDSWHDIAGYAKLIADTLKDEDDILIVTPSDFQKETPESIDG